MIKLELELEALDYDALMDQFLPAMIDKLRQTGNPVALLISNGMPAAMAKGILHKLPQDVKDQLTADLINSYGGKLAEQAELFAQQQGISVKVRSVGAHAE
ncbi:MAG: hypothetical protein H6Q60_343 [Oscillospiraceae bacterium]|nr:hypothetical protein [Oscillospiraceae bacterium]